MCAAAFRCVLEYAHGGRAQLSARTAFATLRLADFLQMAALRGRCASFIASTLSVDTVAATLDEALGVGEEALAARCMEMIEANTTQVRPMPP